MSFSRRLKNGSSMSLKAVNRNVSQSHEAKSEEIIMRINIIAATVALSLSGCAEIGQWEAEMDAEQDAADIAKCEKRGFSTGTSAMATCLQTISSERQAEQDRYEREYEREEAERKAKKK